MWIQTEIGDLINLELAERIVPDHIHQRANVYAGEMILAADSRVAYHALFPDGKTFRDPSLETESGPVGPEKEKE